MLDIVDGTDNTIAVVDAPPQNAVIWSKPEDFDAQAPDAMSRLMGDRAGTWVGMCNGRAHFMEPKYLCKKYLGWLFKIDDLQVIPTGQLWSDLVSETIKAKTKRQRQMEAIRDAIFADSTVHFPAAANYDKRGNPLLSWRVHLLPHLHKEDAGNDFLSLPADQLYPWRDLYSRFHLNEPWDSEHNKTLIEQMPSVFRTVDDDPLTEGRTSILGVSGRHSIFSGPKQTRPEDITDGEDRTIMIVDAPVEHSVIWTKPEDFDGDAPGPLERLMGNRLGAWVGLGSGPVVFLRGSSVPPDEFHNTLTIDGHEKSSSGRQDIDDMAPQQRAPTKAAPKQTTRH